MTVASLLEYSDMRDYITQQFLRQGIKNAPHYSHNTVDLHYVSFFNLVFLLHPVFPVSHSRFPSLSSRQRYVLGDGAMQRMAQSSVFLSGMGGLGVEIGW